MKLLHIYFDNRQEVFNLVSSTNGAYKYLCFKKEQEENS